MHKEIRSTAKHFFVYQAGEVLSKAVGFLLIPLYTRVFSPDQYGTLTLLLIISTFISVIAGMGIISGMARSFYDYDNEGKRKIVFSSAFYSTLCFVTPIILLSFVFYKNISDLVFKNSIDYNLVILLIFFSFVSIIRLPGMTLLKISKKSISYTMWIVVAFIIRCLAIIYMVLVLKLGIKGVLFGNIIASIFQCFIYIQIRKYFVFSFDFNEFKKMLKFGLPLVPDGLVFIVLSMGDRFFINHYFSTAEVGIYSLGAKFSLLLMVFIIQPLRNIWSATLFSIKKSKDSHNYYIEVFEGFMLAAFIFSTLISLFVYDALRIMSHTDYWGAYSIVPILFLSQIFLGSDGFVAVGVMLKRKTFYLPIIKVLAATINIFGNFMLVPRYGMYGAAIATSFSFFIMFLLTLSISRKFEKIDYHWNRILVLIFYSAIVVIISNYFNGFSIKLSILFRIILFLSYITVIFLGGVLTKIERVKMKNFVIDKTRRLVYQ